MTYHIKETREFYGPKRTTHTVRNYWGDPETFATREAAQARIDDFEAQRYTLAHGERDRPAYKIAKART